MPLGSPGSAGGLLWCGRQLFQATSCRTPKPTVSTYVTEQKITPLNETLMN